VYFLVQLHDEPGQPRGQTPEHEPFIDQLIARNVALVGGRFPEPPQPGVFAAYVLLCDTREDAQAIAATDPFLTTGQATATVVPWEIVAINPAAMKDELVFQPEDVHGRSEDSVDR
jgi:uncharacterized protein YciI